MLKLHYHLGRILVLTACCMAVPGCDSPDTMYGSLLGTTAEDQFSGPGGNDALRRRLLEAHRDYWKLISSEYQHERLPDVLKDPNIPELRTFGITQVAVLLRDGEALEEELRLVVLLLDDKNPSVREVAAKLLPEIPEINVSDLSEHAENSQRNPISLPEYVASLLVTELSPKVAKLELAFFQTRPHPAAVEPVIKRLKQGPVDQAASTMFELLKAKNVVPEDRKEHIFKIVRRSPHTFPSLITLKAMLGDSTVQQGLIHLLKDPDESTRIAVARGFASAGFAEPLIALAADEVLYSFALDALRERADIDAFIDLMKLQDLHKDTDLIWRAWRAAAIAIAVSLDTSVSLQADDILQNEGMDELRLKILKTIWEDSSGSPTERKDIAQRTVLLLIETLDAVGAYQLVVAFGKDKFDDDLLTSCFKALIDASEWDAAANIRIEHNHWIEAWESFQISEPETAAAILQQIKLRFDDNDMLTESERSLLFGQVDATPDQNP